MITEGLARYAADQLANLTFTLTSGGNTFIENMPSAPDNAVAFYFTGGEEADTKLPYDSPSVQAMIRTGRDPRPGIEMWQLLYSLLHGLRNIELPDGTYLVSCIAVQSSPVRIGVDETGRHRYSLNLRCEIKSETTHRT